MKRPEVHLLSVQGRSRGLLMAVKSEGGVGGLEEKGREMPVEAGASPVGSYGLV